MSQASTLLALGPEFLLTLDDLSGDWQDASANNRDFTYVFGTRGTASLVPSEPGGYSATNAVGSLASASWMNTNEFSTFVRGLPTTAGDNGNGEALLSRYGASAFFWLMWRNLAGRAALQAFVAGTARNITSSLTWPSGTTRDVGVSVAYNSGTNTTTLKLYEDGVETASGSWTGAVSQGTRTMLLGRYSDSVATDFVGSLDNAAYFSRVLTPTEFADITAAGNAAGPTLGAASLTGDSTLTAAGLTRIRGTAALTGEATLSATGSTPGAATVYGSASLVGDSLLTATDGTEEPTFVPPRPGLGIRFGCSNVNNVRVSSVPPDELARLVPLKRVAASVEGA